MKGRDISILVLVTLTACLAPSATSACMKCVGQACASDEWCCGKRCKTYSWGQCRTFQQCGESKPIEPDPPIVVSVVFAYALDFQQTAGLPAVVQGGDSQALKAAIAVATGQSTAAIHLRDAMFDAGSELAGEPDEAVEAGTNGFVYSAEALDSTTAQVKVCTYAGGPIEVAGEDTIPSGQAYLVPAVLAGQTAVLAARITVLSEPEFENTDEQIQQDLWADLNANREFPAYNLVPGTAPGSCSQP